MKIASSLGPLVATMGLGLLLGAGCGNGNGGNADMAGGSTCAAETRADVYKAGLQRASTNKLYNVTLVSSTPAPPIKGDNTLLVTLTDGSNAVDGATIAVNLVMPDHGHGTPIKVVVTPMGSGQYQLAPLNLFMSGLWRVEINVTTQKGVDQAVFQFCIEG